MPMSFEDSLKADLEHTFYDVNEFAQVATIIRGSQQQTNVPVIVTSGDGQSLQDPSPVSHAVNDAMITTMSASYQLNDVVVTPLIGDKIVIPDGATYMVQPKGKSNHVYRFCDHNRTRLEIYAKKV